MSSHRRLSSRSLTLTAHRAPSVLPRIAGVLARLDIVPERFACTVAGGGASRLVVDIEMAELEASVRRRLEDLLAGLIDVIEVAPAPPRRFEDNAASPVLLAAAAPMG